jgi:predicted lipid-binding transport protein (Tim44 family)
LATAFLIYRLGNILGMHIGFKIETQNDGKFSDGDYVEEITRENDRKELDEKIRNISNAYQNFEQYDFIEKAKKTFEIVFTAYAACDKRTLRNLLAPRIYEAFVMAIDDRISRRETLEGFLERFVTADIVDANVANDDVFVSVKFVTEQSTVLKSENGAILEGNSDFVETRTDIWVFHRKKSSLDPKWLLHEIKDVDNA